MSTQTPIPRPPRGGACRRDYNRRRVAFERAATPDLDHQIPLLCECGNGVCFHAIWITIAEFEHIHMEAARYIVKPRHVIPGSDRVVEAHDRFWVVAKAWLSTAEAATPIER